MPEQDEPKPPTGSRQRLPTNPRQQAERQERSLLLAVIAFLLIVGGALIYALYGGGGLVTALACLLPGVGMLVLLWLVVSALGWWANR